MDMKVIALVCQKGGSAKTTTAINLAVEALAYGLEVVIIDLDPQVSACDWADIRADEAPVVTPSPVPHLERKLKAAKEAGADLVFIDTAGRANDTSTAAAAAADLVLIPLQPSLADLKTLDATLQLVKERPRLAILTRTKTAGSRHDDARTWLESQGVEVCPATLGERVTYQDAYAQGLGVTEAEPSGKAAQEIQQVYLYISKLLGLPTRRKKADEESQRPSKRVA